MERKRGQEAREQYKYGQFFALHYSHSNTCQTWIEGKSWELDIYKKKKLFRVALSSFKKGNLLSFLIFFFFAMVRFCLAFFFPFKKRKIIGEERQRGVSSIQ